MKKQLIIILLAIGLISCEKEELVREGKMEQFSITSSLVKDEYELFVYLPPVYNSSSKQNQLIIGLDGDFHFEKIADMIAEKSQEGSMPPCLFVGIGNSENRNRDYTPTAFKHGAGGAHTFYQFLLQELIPELESRYQVDPAQNKTLIGNSFGGLFTQFSMFQDRDSNPFDKFISVGSSYWFDSGVIFAYEQQYADSHPDLPVKFFNGMGTLEGGVHLASFEEMNQRLKNRGYKSFELEATYIKKHGHSGAAAIGFKKGLTYVFSK